MKESDLYDLILNQYDHTDQESIMARARKIKNKTLGYISDNSPFEKERTNKKNKGSVGNFVEKEWFGIKNNSSPEPDFKEAGIELKVSPVNNNKILSIKENLKVCYINYFKLHDEDWHESHAKKKINKVLMVYYLYDSNNWRDQEILDIDLWLLKPNEKLIQPEWEAAKNKVREGLAHKLTIKGCLYIGANTSGTGKLVPQPIQIYQKLAKERSFYLQRKFVCSHWQNVRKYESIVESLQLTPIQNFVPALLEAVNKYQGKTIGEIASLFEIPVPSGKAAVATIIKLTIGFKSVKSKIKEFEQLGILVKTVPIKTSDNSLYEAISFPKFVIKEFTQENWDESTLSDYLNRILFVPVSREKRKGIDIKDRVLEKPFFWSPSTEEIETIKHEWESYKNQASQRLNIYKKPWKNKKGYIEQITNLSNEKATEIIHIRPHAQNSDDRDEDNYGTSVIKQSFWLNKKFVEKLVNDSLNE